MLVHFFVSDNAAKIWKMAGSECQNILPTKPPVLFMHIHRICHF